MKKERKNWKGMRWMHLVVGIFIMMLIGACSDELETSLVENQTLLNLTAGFEENAMSRTALVEGRKVEWMKGDKIILFNEESSAVYVALSSGKKTMFVYESGDQLDVNGTYTAVYPASSLNVEDKTIQVKSKQNAVAGGFDPEAAICMAVVAGRKDAVSFRNAGALLKFNVPSMYISQAKSLVISATSGIVHQGVISTDGTATIEWGEADNTSYSLSGPFSADEDYYLVVAPQTLLEGFTAALCNKIELPIDAAYSSTAKETTFNGSKLYTLGSIGDFSFDMGWYEADPNASEFIIRTPEEMMGFIYLANQKENKGFAGKIVKLGADIDLQKYAGHITPIQNFCGTFDGQFHAIQNMVIRSNANSIALFGTTCGNALIKNVILKDGYVESTGFQSSESDSHHIAALVGYAIEGSIEIQNCINWGCDVTSSTHDYVAGLLGNVVVGVKVKMDHCINTADVRCEYFYQPSRGGNAGGILNWHNSIVEISDCVNIGNVYSTQKAGGVTSYIYGAPANCITGCYNASEVTAVKSYSNWLWYNWGAGAIAGTIDWLKKYYGLDNRYDSHLCVKHYGGIYQEYEGSSEASTLLYEQAVPDLNVKFANFPYRFKTEERALVKVEP